MIRLRRLLMAEYPLWPSAQPNVQAHGPNVLHLLLHTGGEAGAAPYTSQVWRCLRHARSRLSSCDP